MKKCPTSCFQHFYSAPPPQCWLLAHTTSFVHSPSTLLSHPTCCPFITSCPHDFQSHGSQSEADSPEEVQAVAKGSTGCFWTHLQCEIHLLDNPLQKLATKQQTNWGINVPLQNWSLKEGGNCCMKMGFPQENFPANFAPE